MNKKDLQKIIREGFQDSGLNEGMFDKFKSAVGIGYSQLEKAQQAIELVLTCLSRNNKRSSSDINKSVSHWGEAESFLKGEEMWCSRKNLKNINDVYKAVKGTKLEKSFDMFVKDLNRGYRNEIDRLGDDTLRGKALSNALSNVDFGEHELSRLKLDLETSHKDWLKKREDAEAAKEAEAEVEAEVEMAEGSARNQTNFRGANLKPGTYPWVKQISESVELEIIEEEDKRETDRYMFASNLKQMIRQAELMMQLDAKQVEEILDGGHDWAQDHVAVAKENLDQVFDFMMNKIGDSTDPVVGGGYVLDKEQNKDDEELEVDLDAEDTEDSVEEGNGTSWTMKKGKNAKPNKKKKKNLKEGFRNVGGFEYNGEDLISKNDFIDFNIIGHEDIEVIFQGKKSITLDEAREELQETYGKEDGDDTFKYLAQLFYDKQLQNEETCEEGSARNFTNRKGMNKKPSSLK